MKAVSKIRRHTQWLPQEIKQFFSQSRRVYQNSFFDIRFAAQKDSEQSQLLIVVPRKIGNAPQRNLFKRRVKAIFHEQGLHNCGYDIGIFAKAGAHTVQFSELSEILISLCKKIPA